MKQLFMMMLLAVTFILVGGQVNQVEAADYYVGTYKDGNDAYLMTETIRHDNTVARAGIWYCTVKAVKGNNAFYIDYTFYADSEGWKYQNTQGFHAKVTYRTPIAQRILDYMVPNNR